MADQKQPKKLNAKKDFSKREMAIPPWTYEPRKVYVSMRQNVIFIPILGDSGVSTNFELLFNSRTKELLFSTNALRPTKKL